MASASQEPPPGPRTAPFLEKADAFCERAILGLVLAILVWGPLAYGAVTSRPGTEEAPHLYGYLVIQGLTVMAALFWVARFFTQRPFRLLWPPICWGVLAFVLYAVARCQLAVIDYAAQQELMFVIEYAALFFIIVNNLTRRESATIVAVALIALALGESLFGIYQAATHDPKIWAVFKPAGYVHRASGTFVNPNNFAGFAEMVLPLALAYTLMGRLQATLKVLIGYSALLMLVAIILAVSRGGIIATGVMLTMFCLFLLFQRDYWKRAALALVVICVIAAVLIPHFGAVERRFETVLAQGANAQDGRTLYWRVAREIFHQHFWWGAGPGHFRHEYHFYSPRWYYGSPINAHSDYLNTLCEWGWVGLTLILAPLGLLFSGVSRTWPYLRRTASELGNRNSSKAAFVFGASLGLVAIMIHAAVDYNMQMPANAVIAITFMALLTAHWRFATERFWVNPGRLGKVLVAATILGAGAYLAARGAQAGREFYWLNRAVNEKQSWDKQWADLTTARKIAPTNPETYAALGESRRLRAWQGDPGNEKLAQDALGWFAKSMALDPFDSFAPLCYGMCLDWLDRPREATPYFVRANMLDPNGSFPALCIGWHCVDLGNYPLAKVWLQRSINLHPSQEASGYLEMVNERLAKPSPFTPLPR